MKPSHRVFCRDCNRSKILFDTEKRALTFIKFNADEILEETGKKPIRAYYCISCGGWHVTSLAQYKTGLWSTTTIMEKFNEGIRLTPTTPEPEEEKPKGPAKTPPMDSAIKEARNQVRSIYREVQDLLRYYKKDDERLKESLMLEYKAFTEINEVYGEFSILKKLLNIFNSHLGL